MYTLQNIKDAYYTDLALGIVDRGFEEYLRENYERVYDDQLNFIGYVPCVNTK